MQSENIRVQIHTDTILPVTTSRFLAPYRQKLADSFSTILAVTTDDLLKERPGGSLGNLVTSAVFEYYMADNNANGRPIFVLMNYGGIRLKNIPKGEISVGKIFELLPFENTLVKIEIAGPQLANLLDTINNEGGWPCRWSENYFSSAEELKSQKNVFLLTNNYLAQGGDNCAILKTLPQEESGILLRDIVMEYLRKQKTITPDNTTYRIE